MRGSVGSTVATAFPVARALWAPLSAEERRHSRPSSRNVSQMRSVNGQGSAPMYTHNSQCVVTNDSPATRRLTRRLAYTGSARSPSGLAAAPLRCAVCVVTAPPPGVTLRCKADGSEYPS